MTAEEVTGLVLKGHRVGVHGFAHRFMPDSEEEVEASSERSAEILQPLLPASDALLDFAFPFGHFKVQTATALSKKFHYLYTVSPGYWDGVSHLIPRVLLTPDENLEFYETYILGALGFKPPLTLVGEDGATSNSIEYHDDEGKSLANVELMSVSADLNGRLYASYPLGSSITVTGNSVFIDLKSHLKQYYAPQRRVISYALITRENGQLRFLTWGHTHWVEE
jgi:hypothetical protein